MVEGSLGFEGLAINVWLVWMLPFIGAAAIVGIARYGHKIRDYSAVSFSLGSAIFATTLLPLGISGGEIHSQIPWISTLGLEAGVLADPLSIIMTNLVAWVSFLIFVYSIGYMHGDRDLTRFWFSCYSSLDPCSSLYFRIIYLWFSSVGKESDLHRTP